jgi:outer membrane protein
MKKLKFLVIAVALLIAGNTVMAQNKVGYISVDGMVMLMPETRKVDSLLQRYQSDSLNPQLSYLIQEYNRKDSLLKDSVKLGKAVTAQIKQEMANIEYQVQNWQAFVQEAVNAKQQGLLEPIYRKVIDAINQVAKESGYSHVYNKEALLVAPTADDLLLLVAKKLKVTVPTSVTAGTPK